MIEASYPEPRLISQKNPASRQKSLSIRGRQKDLISVIKSLDEVLLKSTLTQCLVEHKVAIFVKRFRC